MDATKMEHITKLQGIFRCLSEAVGDLSRIRYKVGKSCYCRKMQIIIPGA